MAPTDRAAATSHVPNDEFEVAPGRDRETDRAGARRQTALRHGRVLWLPNAIALEQ